MTTIIGEIILGIVLISFLIGFYKILEPDFIRGKRRTLIENVKYDILYEILIKKGLIKKDTSKQNAETVLETQIEETLKK